MLLVPSDRATVAVEAVKAIGAGSRAAAIVALIVRVARLAAWATGATDIIPVLVVSVHAVVAAIALLMAVKVSEALAFPELATVVVQLVRSPSLHPTMAGEAAAPSAIVPALLMNVQKGSTIITWSLTARALLHSKTIVTELSVPL